MIKKIIEIMKAIYSPVVMICAITGLCIIMYTNHNTDRPKWYDKDRLIIEYLNDFYILKPLELKEKE